jgi:catechol 2,3-dioxygenase-like lactoylglutathione lyase family enzyme
MSADGKITATELTPIFYVRDFNEAVRYYTEKLLFRKLWDWGTPPTFGAVALDKVEIFLCEGAQGHPGTWLSIFVEDVDWYYERIKVLGAEVVEPPKNYPWGMREMRVRDPNEHVIRFGHGIPSREPKLPVERVRVEARIEKRLAGLLGDLAAHKKMTLGETIEEMMLHSFEKVDRDGVASPHTKWTHDVIGELKKKHGIEYDCHANYRFEEKGSS